MKALSKENELEIRSLYERYASLVHSRCRMLLKSEDEAWDATQEVFMKLIGALPKINKKESIYSWLLSTSTNHCFSLLRKKKHLEFNEEYHTESKGLPQEKWMALKEIIHHFLSPWDSKIREVVIYTYFDGYRQEEIAKITGMGESTIRRHLTRFKRKCAESGLSMGDLL
ncbi:MAG: RNA polymerase sigma factor [Fibrobacter sp.]|jgi:RNA polymerase sigma-70 factor (ECF subfamily)|nr:RNA polymerase sigma factor [Fibrobacter sp.]